MHVFLVTYYCRYFVACAKTWMMDGGRFLFNKLLLLQNTCMQKPSPCSQNIIYSKHEVFKVVVMVTQ
jgi:hypothetical protein